MYRKQVDERVLTDRPVRLPGEAGRISADDARVQPPVASGDKEQEQEQEQACSMYMLWVSSPICHHSIVVETVELP